MPESKKQTDIEEAAVDTLKPGGAPGEQNWAAISGSKAQMLQYILQVAGGLSNEDLNNFAASLAQIGHEADQVPGDADSNRATISAKPSAAVSEAVKEDLAVLFGDNKELTEEFRTQATTLFEAAVNARVELVAAELEEAKETELNEAIDEVVENMVEAVDTHLEYLADKWLEENEVAIESALRAELMENFLQGLHALFNDHYINVPSDQVDVVESLVNRIDELEDETNNAINENIDLRAQLADEQKARAFEEAASGLTNMDKEKLRTLSESVEFTDAENYKKSVKNIAETFVSGKKTGTKAGSGLITEGVEEPGATIDEGDEVKSTNPQTKTYVDALSRSVRGRR